ncbi:MAG: hypothetical protein SOR61_03510 [Evtepia sp.]|uniref:hypothetical protein n=1 Tax=Evtepia sp. TaxID=2773933 RepID=UPI002A7578C0|nr:hypothetical protein [Evtepia sp.]MDY3014251.1 hypothetical protein [Evtepia sp.]
MKKLAILFFVCLFAAFGCIGAASLAVHTDKDQVTVTEKTLKGDPSAAQGLVARQTARNLNFQWDLTIPLGDLASTTAQATAAKDVPQDDLLPAWVQDNYFTIDLTHSMGVGGEPGFTLKDLRTGNALNDPVMAPILEDVGSRTPLGGSYTEKISPQDYGMTYYPVKIRMNLAGVEWTDESWNAMQKAFQNYFRFPIPEDAQWTVTIEKDMKGLFTKLDVKAPSCNGVNVPFAVSQNSLFFAVDSGGEWSLPSFAQVKDGYGIYRLDLTAQADGTRTPDLASLRMVHPLDPAGTILDLTWDEGNQRLLLTDYQDGAYTCTTFDPETMAVQQTLSLPGDKPQKRTVDGYTFTEYAGYRCWAGDNFLLFRGKDGFLLFDENLDGSYTHRFTGQLPEESIGLDPADTVIVWNGETLAIGQTSIIPGLRLMVYNADGQLLYHGIYRTSLNESGSLPGDETKAGVSEEDVRLLPSQPLTLSWE